MRRFVIVLAACGGSSRAPNEATPPSDARITESNVLDAVAHDARDASASKVTCTEDTFDPRNPDCLAMCSPKAPKGWPACKGICPDPPEVENPACWSDRCDPMHPDSFGCQVRDRQKK